MQNCKSLTNNRAYQKILWSSNFLFQRSIKLINPLPTHLQICMTKSIISQDTLRRLIFAPYKTMHSKAEHLHNCKVNRMKQYKPLKRKKLHNREQEQEQTCMSSPKSRHSGAGGRLDM